MTWWHWQPGANRAHELVDVEDAAADSALWQAVDEGRARVEYVMRLRRYVVSGVVREREGYRLLTDGGEVEVGAWAEVLVRDLSVG